MKIKYIFIKTAALVCILMVLASIGVPEIFKREYRVINREALLALNLRNTLTDSRYQFVKDIGVQLNLIRTDSILDQAGLVKGDLLLTINDIPIDDLINEHEALDMISIGNIYVIVIRRKNSVTSTDEIIELMIDAPYVDD